MTQHPEQSEQTSASEKPEKLQKTDKQSNKKFIVKVAIALAAVIVAALIAVLLVVTKQPSEALISHCETIGAVATNDGVCQLPDGSTVDPERMTTNFQIETVD